LPYIPAAEVLAGFPFLHLHGWHYGERIMADPLLHRQAMTMTLLAAVTCQLLNVWTMRSFRIFVPQSWLFFQPLAAGGYRGGRGLDLDDAQCASGPEGL
jgi:sodium/potassium-transporting ATPase subunit alpha